MNNLDSVAWLLWIPSAALFQSLLYEACGRTVNPVFGAVGLLWGGKWQACQAAVDTVLKGGSLRPRSLASVSSSCLPSDLNFAAPFPSLPLHAKGWGASPARESSDSCAQLMSNPLSNSLSQSFADLHKVRLGMGLSHASGRPEVGEHFDGRGRGNRPGGHQESALRQNMSRFSTWPKSGSFDYDMKKQNPQPVCGGQKGDVLEVCKKRETEFVEPYGAAHVVIASPRRVRARLDAATLNPFSREGANGDVPVQGSGIEQLELDLTLKVKGTKEAQMVGKKRLSSPCESVNSEGSVTSLDSTPDPSKPSNWTLKMGLMPPPLRKLLPLLQ